MSWKASNGTSITKYRTLEAAYQTGQLPSKSFGIHVGSVDFNIPASLTLGGYDRSRCITDPIVSDDIFVTLVGVSLGIAAGNSSFINLPQGDTTSLLQANGSAVSELSIRPNPGMPYIYLPRETCDAIASHLPVTYSRDFNVYFWNVSDPAYERIIRTPHYLSFAFASGSGLTRSIDVPFALLNLTMDEPLMPTPTPYFPCSPWLPSAAPYNFGRSFLQAAFLAQNWQAGKLYLAQAPGPDHAAPDIQPIAYTDTTLHSLPDAPTWFSTWSGTFDALAETPTNTSSTTGSKGNDSSVSKGTIAGAVIGALAGLALIISFLLWLIRRHKKTRAAVSHQETASIATETLPQYSEHGRADQKVESGAEAIHEVAADPRPPAELNANQDSAKMDQKNEPVELATEETRFRS